MPSDEPIQVHTMRVRALRLHASGAIDGLRIDHVRDAGETAHRLVLLKGDAIVLASTWSDDRAAIPPAQVAEKILARAPTLRVDPRSDVRREVLSPGRTLSVESASGELTQRYVAAALALGVLVLCAGLLRVALRARPLDELDTLASMGLFATMLAFVAAFVRARVPAFATVVVLPDRVALHTLGFLGSSAQTFPRHQTALWQSSLDDHVFVIAVDERRRRTRLLVEGTSVDAGGAA